MADTPSPQGESSADERLPVPPADVVLWAAIGGALLGLAILFADLAAWDADDRARADEGPFLLWAGAIAVQTMAWVLLLPPIRAIARRVRSDAAARSRELRLATLALALLGAAIAVVPPLIGDLPETIPHRGVKVAVLNLAAFALAIYGARAIWYAGVRFRTIEAANRTDLGAIEEHRRLRADLEFVLGALGTLVTLAVIASAALRALTVAADPERALPAESVILYGVVLSLLLTLVYVPAYLAMLRAGQALRNRIAELVEPSAAGFGDRIDQRARLDALLGLNVAATVSFRAGVAILSPLLGSLTSLLPKLGG